MENADLNLGLNGRFPLAVLVVVIIQTLAAIWWASGLTTTVNLQGESIKELKLTVTALTSAKVVVLEAEVARLQAELMVSRAQQRK